MLQSLTELLSNPLLWKVLIGYWVFNALVDSIATPSADAKGWGWALARFAFRFLHSLGGNLKRAAVEFKVPGAAVSLLAVLLLTTAAGAQGVRTDNFIINRDGHPVPGAIVRLCTQGATHTDGSGHEIACSPTVTLYADITLTGTIANPTTADGVGNYHFYTACGTYLLQVQGYGLTLKTIPDFPVPCTSAITEITGGACTAGQFVTEIATDGTPTCAVVSERKTCMIVVGSDNGSALVDADIGPQGRRCQVAAASTLIEMTVAADAGTPSVIAGRNHAGTIANIVSGALATASSGGIACAKGTATTGLNGVTTCSATLQNTAIAAGDWLELVSGTAGGTAKRISVAVTFTTP